MIKKQKKYHHGDLKTALVRAGLEILETEGRAALTLRAIAARAGVSHTAPKNHFDGLHGLLAAIAAEGFRMHAAEMRRGVEGMPAGRARLDAATEGYVRFAQEHPALFSLMFSPSFDRNATKELQEAGAESYAVLSSIAKGLEWPKTPVTGDPRQDQQRTEMMLWSLVHGYAILFLSNRMPRDADGAPVFSVLDVMPRFDYGPDV